MRPCATVLRKIFPCSIPGSRRVWVYSARPVTFSRASRRGNERPTWWPALVVVIPGVALVGGGLLGVRAERLGGILDEAHIEHVLDRHRTVDLLGVLEELPGVLEAVDIDVAVRIDHVRDERENNNQVLYVQVFNQDHDHLNGIRTGDL